MNWLVAKPHPLPSDRPPRVRASRAKPRRYVMEDCHRCGKPFVKKMPWMKYCGDECRNAAHYDLKIQRMRDASALKPKTFTLACHVCGSQYTSKRQWSRYCSQLCRNRRAKQIEKGGKRAS